MIKTSNAPIKDKVLVIEPSLMHPHTAMGRSVLELIDEFESRGAIVTTAIDAEDAMAAIMSDASVHGVMLSWELEDPSTPGSSAAMPLLDELAVRHKGIPVFLMARRSESAKEITEEVMSKVTEFVWMLEDTIDFVAGRMLAAVERYRDQLLPPFAAALAKYSMRREESWSAPGHQGGVAFTKVAVGRAFFDFYGENLFRTDMGIERGELGSLLDHTGPIADSERYAAKVFGADRSYNVVGGTSESNRSIMQACMVEGDVVVCDRNCHKSIEQGLMLTGALPVYMVPTRNRYGIIGPIHADAMTADAIREKIASSALTRGAEHSDPVYAVLTNCTYDGLCYNAADAQDLLGEVSPRIHFDEAWYGYARFNPMYENHYAMRGKASDHPDDAPTVFATHSTHKLLAALSQASYIHVRDGRQSISHDRFNQSYMMHATTSPLYAIIASNDIASAMMDGSSGEMLTGEVIAEAVSFRQAVARMYVNHSSEGGWFFKPWNAEVVNDPETGESYRFEDAPLELLVSEQDCWRLHPEDEWHGFTGLRENWCMLDPIKVSLLTPGMGEDGELLDSGVPASLFTAYVSRLGAVPTRTTDFQVMFLFSVGVTKGKWATLINMLLEFKRFYDNNSPLSEVLPELVKSFPARYGELGLKDLGDEMFSFLKENNPGRALNDAYSIIPDAAMTPRAAFQRLVRDEVELVPANQLSGRIAANAVMPYPPGIPLLMSGESFGDDNSAQISYLKTLGIWDREFPGFEHVVEGAEVIDGVYNVLCIKQ